MKRFFHKALRPVAIFLAVFALLLVAFYAEEDWRGARDWAACQRDLAARGESLDLRVLAPPGKPEDDLSKVPIFAELYQEGNWDKARMNKLRIELSTTNSSRTPKADYRRGQSVDLAAWQKFYLSEPTSHLTEMSGSPAQDVLQVLSRFDPELDEIDRAVSNPNAYFPIDYEMPFATRLPGVTSMIRVAQILQLKGVAHLENHQADLAEKDYLFSFRLCKPLAKGCFTVNYLVIAVVRTNSILWEGMHRHAWNEAQLREMESAEAAYDMLNLAAISFQTERASFLKVVDVVQIMDTDMRRRIQKAGLGFIAESALFRPGGWWNEDRVIYSQTAQKWIDGIDLNRKTLSPAAFPQHPLAGYVDDNSAADITLWSKIYTPLSSASIPALENVGPSIASAETYRRLARLACRLEEYRIAHGAYADTLDELPDLPPHLNQEVLSEQPLQYQRKGEGYRLYSLGWNQKDDGGVYSTDLKEGDWVWPSP